MTDVSRLDQEMADALGLAQAVRRSAADARDRGAPGKLDARLAEIQTQVAALQERLNELVVADPAKRGRLVGRSRRQRESEGRLPDDADLLDSLQALAADAAHAVAQWRVVAELAKASGDKETRKLVKRTLPAAEDHLELALKACTKVARRQAEALAGERGSA
jgi:hypothetical protein